MHNGCPDSQTLKALLSGGLTDADQLAAEEHLDSCAVCQERLQEMAGLDAVLPKTSIPIQLRAAADSKQLADVVRTMRQRPSASQTAIGVPDTDVVPLSGAPIARGGFVRRPQRIGDYDVQAVLGRGGIGLVYRATDRVLGREVAIKLLRSDLADNEPMRERFLREARAAAAIRQDHVVAIYGVGEHEEQPYLVMEYVPGGSLADRLLRKGKLASAEVIRLGIEVASGLAAAHAKGIIHRDVKPGNVLWDAEAGRYKLTDFGLAKALDEVGLTRSGIVAGTPEYLSPEQAEGEDVDARSDLFSLGAMLYAACAGQSPFHAETTMGVLHRVRTHAPPDLRDLQPECALELTNVVRRLLTKAPDKRYQSAGAVVDELRRIENACNVGVQTASARASKSQTSRAALPRRAAVAALVLIAVLGGLTWYATRDTEPVSSAGETSVSPERGFTIAGDSAVHESLSAAVAAAPPNGVIEVHGSGRQSIAPVRIEGKPLTIRAARGSRPTLTSSAETPITGSALRTDSDLTLEGLQFQWSAASAASQFPDAGALGSSAVASTGGVLRINRCEFAVGKDTVCVAIDRAAGELRNSRLLASQSTCVFWRPAEGSKLVSENCIYTGRCCISCIAVTLDETVRTDLPASLQLVRNTWQGQKGLQVVFGAALRRPMEVRANGNTLGVEHLLVFYRAPRGPRSFISPSIEFIQQALPNQLRWQERENAYPASFSFLSAQSPNQTLKAIDGGPSDVATWDAFWKRPDSGSRQGASAAELRGKVGADESVVGPEQAEDAAGKARVGGDLR